VFWTPGPPGAVTPNIGLAGKFTAGTVRTFTVAGAKYVSGGSALAVPANAARRHRQSHGRRRDRGRSSSISDRPLPPPAPPQRSTLSWADTRANNVTVASDREGLWKPSIAAAPRVRRPISSSMSPGYFLAGTSGATYHSLAPGRVLDTRATGSGDPHRPAHQATLYRYGQDLPRGRREGSGLDRRPGTVDPPPRSPAT